MNDRGPELAEKFNQAANGYRDDEVVNALFSMLIVALEKLPPELRAELFLIMSKEVFGAEVEEVGTLQ